MMNIVLINHYAGSPDMGMEFRPYYMAREWVKAGHKVHIYAAEFSHLRKVNPIVEQDFAEETIDGIYYHWIKAGSYTGNGLKRAVTMVRFVGKLIIHAKKIVKECKPDAIITSSTYPLDTFAGQRLKHLGKAKLVHEIHDMWPISPMELGGMSKFHPFIILMQVAENSFCKRSDMVVSLLPNAKEYLVSHGMKEEKFATIPNGIVQEEWAKRKGLPKEHAELLEGLKKDGRQIIGFFGSHTKSYALEYLIDAIRQLGREDICAVLTGSGIEKDNLIKYAKGLENQIYFLPPVDKSCIPALLEKMDLIYVGALNNKMFRFGICMNKLFDSMMSGKPILYAVDAPNNYIVQYQCGISVEPENVEALKRGMIYFLEMAEKEKEEMGQNGHRAVLNNFEYSVLADKFLKVLRS